MNEIADVVLPSTGLSIGTSESSGVSVSKTEHGAVESFFLKKKKPL